MVLFKGLPNSAQKRSVGLFCGVTKITLMQGGKFQRSGNLKSDDTSSTRLVTTIEVHEVDNHPQDKPSD